MHLLFDDMRHALRSLQHGRGATLLAVALFAVSIGVTTAIYAAVEAVMLRPGPLPAPSRTVVAWQRDDTRGTPVVEASYGEVETWGRNARSLDAVGAFSSVTWTMALLQGEARTRLAYVAASPAFFKAVGVAPALGRTVSASDETASEPQVAVISEAIWQQRFGANPRVVGTLMRVQASIDSPVRTIEIVGVMPRGFDFPRGTQMWLPAAPTIRGFARRAGQRADGFLTDLRVFYALGRVREGFRASQVQQELGAIARRSGSGNAAGAVTGATVTLIDTYLQGAARPVLWTMLGGGLLMVLLACSSVAGLQVFRAALADRSLAVHLALGAKRRSLVVRALGEGVWLALAGVAGSVLVAVLAVKWLSATTPLDVPGLANVRVATEPVLAFMAVLTVAVGVLAGVWPALFVGRIDAARTLTAGARAVMHPRERRFQRLVVGWQVAVAVVLLAGAALFVRSVRALDRTDVGFRPEGLAALEIQSSFAPLDRADVFHGTLLSRIRDLPGVEAAGAIALRPLSGPIGNDVLPVLEGQEGLGENAPWRRNPRANLESIAAGSFRTLGMPLLSGRDFEAGDVDGAREVVIVSESAAARYWPGRNPVGQRLVVASQRNPPGPRELRWQTVVGVVSDARYRGLLDPRLDIYLPAAQSTMRLKDVLVRITGDPEPVFARIRAVAHELDPGAFVSDPVLMRDAVARESAPWRFAMRVLTFFGALAAVLSTVGLVGVVWMVVTMRSRELGVRAALGATPNQLRQHVLAEAVWTAGAATAIGIAGALAVGRAVAGFLVNTSPYDAASLIAAALITTGAGAAGCLLASRRAARVNPVEAMRD